MAKRFSLPPLPPNTDSSLRFALERIELFLNEAVPVLEANVRRGAGSPEGVVTGNVGNIWLQSDGGIGTTIWIKEVGNGTNTGWDSK